MVEETDGLLDKTLPLHEIDDAGKFLQTLAVARRHPTRHSVPHDGIIDGDDIRELVVIKPREKPRVPLNSEAAIRLLRRHAHEEIMHDINAAVSRRGDRELDVLFGRNAKGLLVVLEDAIENVLGDCVETPRAQVIERVRQQLVALLVIVVEKQNHLNHDIDALAVQFDALTVIDFAEPFKIDRFVRRNLVAGLRVEEKIVRRLNDNISAISHYSRREDDIQRKSQLQFAKILQVTNV